MKHRRPWIYVAGPYTSPDPAINTRVAILAGQAIRDRWDAVVIVPHFSHFEHLLAPRPYEYWLKIDFELLLGCDALFRLPGESKGADAEVAFAKQNGVPTFHALEGGFVSFMADWDANNTEVA